MGESLVVEVYRLRAAQEQVAQRLHEILQRVDPMLAETDDVSDLLDSVESEVVRLLEQAGT